MAIGVRAVGGIARAGGKSEVGETHLLSSCLPQLRWGCFNSAQQPKRSPFVCLLLPRGTLVALLARGYWFVEPPPLLHQRPPAFLNTLSSSISCHNQVVITWAKGDYMANQLATAGTNKTGPKSVGDHGNVVVEYQACDGLAMVRPASLCSGTEDKHLLQERAGKAQGPERRLQEEAQPVVVEQEAPSHQRQHGPRRQRALSKP
jgi:hypothetical protein